MATRRVKGAAGLGHATHPPTPAAKPAAKPAHSSVETAMRQAATSELMRILEPLDGADRYRCIKACELMLGGGKLLDA